MKSPKVSVVITTKNEQAVIGNLLESLKRQTYKFVEIIVVDNASTDETRKIARRYTDLVFCQGPERSRQRNFGVQKASGKYVLVLDADMELEKRVIEECVELLVKKPKIKAVVIPEKSFGIGFWAKCKRLERNCYLGDEEIEAARLFNKKTFLEFGGYDEKITGPEDWDLPQRIKRKHEVGRVKSFIRHNEGRLSLTKTMKKKFYYAQKFVFYARKHPKIARRQANLVFRAAFLHHWRDLLKTPILALGMFFMRSCEMTAGGFGYLAGMKKNKKRGK